MSMALKKWLIIATGINLKKKSVPGRGMVSGVSLRRWKGSHGEQRMRVLEAGVGVCGLLLETMSWFRLDLDQSLKESLWSPSPMPISSVDSHDHERYPHPILSPIPILSPWSPC